QDLGAPGAPHDVVAEPQSGAAKALHLRGDVVHHELKAVPAARSGLPAVRHGPSGRAGPPAEQEPKAAAGDVGEGGGGAGEEGEAEVSGVEGDGGIDIVDHVTDIDHRHGTIVMAPPLTRGCSSGVVGHGRTDGEDRSARRESRGGRRRGIRKRAWPSSPPVSSGPSPSPSGRTAIGSSTRSRSPSSSRATRTTRT